MSKCPRIPFQPDLRLLSIGPEISHRLGDCIETARLSLKPRTFAEDYLVEEMAIARWRATRTKIMEKAVYDRQATTWCSRRLKTTDGNEAESYEDMYHLAMANSPETSRIVLTALSRLESRYYQQFCGAFRLLLAARRGTPPSLTDRNDTLYPASFLNPPWSSERNPDTNPESSTQSNTEKENE